MTMQIKQFEDKNLSHYSYAILSGGYRSAAASSLIHSKLNGSVKVFDLEEASKEFQ
jgi:hypothetical protein